jgi:serine/threonine protein kinase
MKFTFAPESRPLAGYVIKRAIHRGGFGEVYYALTDAGRQVALKLLNHNMEVELRGVKQCLNLNHPNLVTIFDIRQDADRDHWIVMEYVGGSSLLDVLQRHPSGIPVPQILHWLAGISAGLAFLHDRGLVHRDLKPANVLSDGEQVKIADVGLSKYISESRRSAQTQSVGTVYYMAPEVSRGRYGREVDVYAVSVMLVEMLTGRLPFDGETTAEILMKHLTSEPDLSGLEPSVQQVLRAGLEKDPDRRIQDILELQRRFCLALQPAGQVAAAATAAADTVKPPMSPAANDNSDVTGGQPERKRQPGFEFFRDWNQLTELAGQPERKRQPGFWEEMRQTWEGLPQPVRWCAIVTLVITAIQVNLSWAEYLSLWLATYGVWYAFKGRKQNRGRGNDAGSREALGEAAKFGGIEPVAPAGRPEALLTTIPGHGSEVRDVRVRGAAAGRPAAGNGRQGNAAGAARTAATLQELTPGERWADVLGSAVTAFPAAAVVTVSLHLLTNVIETPAQAVFFFAAVLMSVWVLLIPSKVWQGVVGDGLMRRTVLMVLGGFVGLGLSYLQSFLLLSGDEIFVTELEGFAAPRLRDLLPLVVNGAPTWAGFVTFFGLLFGVRQWWQRADRMRSKRWGVISALTSAVAGLAAAVLVPFPPALGITLATSISLVLELSASWVPLNGRRIRG